jgi:hypothetical protein
MRSNTLLFPPLSRSFTVLPFLLVPATAGALFGVPAEPHVILIERFFAAALLGLGVIQWIARDFRDWAAVRGVLIGIAVGDVLLLLVNIWGTIRNLMNAFAWSSTILLVLLLIGALYCIVNPSNSRAS